MGMQALFELDENVVNVPRHADTAAFVRVVPGDGNTSKFIAGHIKLHSVIFFENVKEEVEMFDPNIFHTKVINDEGEL